MNEHLFLGDSAYPHDSIASEYLRGKYGAYRGHHAWRDIEAGFNAGLTLANSNAAGRIEQLERHIAIHKAREEWINTHSATSGGDDCFHVSFIVPCDVENIFSGIDAAIQEGKA